MNVGRKAHVKHAVCFVKHKEAHTRQVNKALVFQVNQAARRGNKNVNACFQLLDLRVLGNAAHNGQNAMVRQLRNGRANFGDLLCQLARGCDNQHLRRAALFARLEQIQAGKAERSGFARAGFRAGNNVFAGKDGGNGLLLHSGGLLVA